MLHAYTPGVLRSGCAQCGVEAPGINTLLLLYSVAAW